VRVANGLLSVRQIVQSQALKETAESSVRPVLAGVSEFLRKASEKDPVFTGGQFLHIPAQAWTRPPSCSQGVEPTARFVTRGSVTRSRIKERPVINASCVRLVVWDADRNSARACSTQAVVSCEVDMVHASISRDPSIATALSAYTGDISPDSLSIRTRVPGTQATALRGFVLRHGIHCDRNGISIRISHANDPNIDKLVIGWPEIIRARCRAAAIRRFVATTGGTREKTAIQATASIC
jgi:hypothetical protein